jgi:hypothetical protein
LRACFCCSLIFGKEGVPQPISQKILAEMIGITRSRVSHFMYKFGKLGLISYNGQIEVHSSTLNAVLHEKPHLRERNELAHQDDSPKAMTRITSNRLAAGQNRRTPSMRSTPCRTQPPPLSRGVPSPRSLLEERARTGGPAPSKTGHSAFHIAAGAGGLGSIPLGIARQRIHGIMIEAAATVSQSCLPNL